MVSLENASKCRFLFADYCGQRKALVLLIASRVAIGLLYRPPSAGGKRCFGTPAVGGVRALRITCGATPAV